MSRATVLTVQKRVVDDLKDKLENQANKIVLLTVEVADARVRAARAEGELVALRETLALLQSERKYAELGEAKMRLEVKVSDLERELRQQWTQVLAVQNSPSPERKKS